MNKPSESVDFLDTVTIISFIFKWKKPLLLVALSATLASLVFTTPFFIKPKYKSSVILFPASTSSVANTLLSDNTSDKQDLLEFGKDEQTSQMLQILNSDEIKSRIIKKYQLMEHYGIDSTSEYPYTQLDNKINENINFERTEFMSVKIEVFDTDREVAANMANDIASFLDSVKTRMQRERAVEVLKIIEKEYNDKLSLVNGKEDLLKKLRGKGIFDYKAQSEILNQEYIKAISVYRGEAAMLPVYQETRNPNDSLVVNTRARIKAAEASMKDLSEKLQILSEFGGDYVSLTEILWSDRSQLAFLRNRYEKAKVDVEQNLSHKFIVNNAVKAEKKSYPIRWLIVLLSVTSSLFLCIIIIIFIENMNRQGVSR
jgi:uncharacterized protein involved in exopolysaccharide biosynthesis